MAAIAGVLIVNKSFRDGVSDLLFFADGGFAQSLGQLLQPLAIAALELGPLSLSIVAMAMAGWRLRPRMLKIALAGQFALSFAAVLASGPLELIASWSPAFVVIFLAWDGAKQVPGPEVRATRLLGALAGGVLASMYVHEFIDGVAESSMSGPAYGRPSGVEVFVALMLTFAASSVLQIGLAYFAMVTFGGRGRRNMDPVQSAAPNPFGLVIPRLLLAISRGETRHSTDANKRWAFVLFVTAWCAFPTSLLLGLLLSSGDVIALGFVVAVVGWAPTTARLSNEVRVKALSDDSPGAAVEVGEPAGRSVQVGLPRLPRPKMSRRARILTAVAGSLLLGISSWAQWWLSRTPEEVAASADDPCLESANLPVVDNPALALALRDRCAALKCAEFNEAVEAGELERAMQATDAMSAAGALVLCDVAKVTAARSAAWATLASTPEADRSKSWCESFVSFRGEMNEKPNLADGLVLPKQELESVGTFCVDLVAKNFLDYMGGSFLDWETAEEHVRLLRALQAQMPSSSHGARGMAAGLDDERAAKVTEAARRTDVCVNLHQARRAETAENALKHLEEASSALGQLGDGAGPGPKDLSALWRTISTAQNEVKRCERMEKQRDACNEKCHEYGEYRSDSWYDRCLDRHCPSNYRTCDELREKWRNAGKPRSNVVVPVFEFCSATWSPTGEGATSTSVGSGSRRVGRVVQGVSSANFE